MQMVLGQAQSGMHEDLPQLLGPAAANALTRRAGGRQTNKPLPKRVITDIREFMSNLPAVLHQQGFEVVPVTLEVGCNTPEM